MKISRLWKGCFIYLIACGSLVVLSLAFENFAEAITYLRQKRLPETNLEPCPFSGDERYSNHYHKEGCNTASRANQLTA